MWDLIMNKYKHSFNEKNDVQIWKFYKEPYNIVGNDIFPPTFLTRSFFFLARRFLRAENKLRAEIGGREGIFSAQTIG